MRTTAGPSRHRSAALPLAIVSTILLAVVFTGQAVGLEPTALPTATPTPTAVVEASAEPIIQGSLEAEPGADRAATDAPTADEPAPAVVVLPGVLAKVGDTVDQVTYLAEGADATGVLPFDTLRLRVQLANTSEIPRIWTPLLEFRRADAPDFVPLPEEYTPGFPLHTTHEWVAVDGGGSLPGPYSAPLTDTVLTPPEGLASAPGWRASGPNQDAPANVPAGTSVEQEFTFRISIEAEFGATYELRVTDAGTPLPEVGVLRVVVAEEPRDTVPDGQRHGVQLSPEFPLVLPEGLATSQAAPTELSAIRVVNDTPRKMHTPGDATSCATCHSTHSAKSLSVLSAVDQATQCYTCHGAAGLGGPPDVATQFAGGKANDPETRTYFSHALVAEGHVLDSSDKIEGQLNRHSQCADCHNPHNVSESSPFGVSGVAVENGPAGTSPTYSRIDGRMQPITAEYQLCFKCHSEWTEQLPDVEGRPSLDRTDLGVALNPNNASYHPVEAPGKNQTSKMAESLAGTSTYKLWDLKTTDTISCTMCHTSNTVDVDTVADASLTVHASENRGILVRPYESRILTERDKAFDASAAGLCLACHAEAPFVNTTGTGASAATNFEFHGKHMSGINKRGNGGTDIDVAGAGQGNALCAECHFRSHGPSDVPGDQKLDGAGLVTFAPNVQPSRSLGGQVSYTRTDTTANCTLTCHGKDHRGATYTTG